MKKYIPVLVLFIVAITLLASCKKEIKKNDCFPDQLTTRIITNKSAIIKQLPPGDEYYIVEQGTIDSRLVPCDLPNDFKVKDLQVIISGEVKATIQAGPGPCCEEHFVITKISK